MKSIKGTKTEQNLLKAFAGESQARTRYDLFAAKAREEGLEQIAALFEETALNEMEHAKRFFSFLEGGPVEITASYPAGKVGTTLENLQEAAHGENEEWTMLYPEFAKIAEEEGFKEVAALFKMVSLAIMGTSSISAPASSIFEMIISRLSKSVLYMASLAGTLFIRTS